MKDSYTYPAILTYDSNGISIIFPDLPYCLSSADSQDEVLTMAADALEGWIELAENKKQNLPEPSLLPDLKYTLKDNQVCILVKADMKPIRARHNNKSVSKMVSLPQWLITEGKSRGINFSQVLQDALLKKLGAER